MCVANGYTTLMATKDAGFRIRIERSLRKSFLEAYRAKDKPTAQVLREFIREYVANRPVEAKRSLFSAERLDGS